jgi:hypothetical protein
MLLVGIEEKHTPNALVVPRKGDDVAWVIPGSFQREERFGIVEMVESEDGEYVFYTAPVNGKMYWGWIENILRINGEPVPNTKANPE